VHYLSPPKSVVLDPKKICRHSPNWLRNVDSQKKITENFQNCFFEIVCLKYLFDFCLNFFLKTWLRQSAKQICEFTKYQFKLLLVQRCYARKSGPNLFSLILQMATPFLTLSCTGVRNPWLVSTKPNSHNFRSLVGKQMREK
jgi:hypothetical protein